MAASTTSPRPARDLSTIESAGPFPPVMYSPPVFEELRRVAVDQFVSIPRGGLEIGGVLFGSAAGTCVTVAAHRPLEIEYLTGPSFLLSEHDKEGLHALLDAAIADPDLAGMKPVGWYHTHTRSSTALTDEDVALHREFFPSEYQIAVVIKPFKFDPADVALYAPAQSTAEPVASFQLEAPQSRDRRPAPQPTPEAPPPAPRAAPTADLPPPPKRSVRTRVLAASALATACLAAVAALAHREPAREPAPESPQLHLADRDRNLSITWTSPTSNVRSAELIIVDGKDATTLPIQFDELRRGSLTYARNSGAVEVRLRIHASDGALTEQIARFLGPAPALALPAEAERARTVEPPAPDPVPTAAPDAPARAYRVLLVPQARTANTAAPILDVNAPAVAVPAGDAAPLPIALGSLPPPPATAASGRAIWTGRLPRDGILLIDGGRPSAGVLTGSIPSRAARIRAYPGDLTGSGLVVYGDRERIEPPSAANGWNMTSYRVDPRRARDLTVLEQPGPQNGWRRLMLKAGGRALPVVVIEWSE